jgi:glycosyltransferase involved in cell wall biosynthesis
MRQELERRSRSEQERGRIQFLGSRSDVPTLLSAADITVLTSDWEGLPIAILESLAAGRPVVATDVGGVGELLRGGGGRLVPPGQPRKAASAIEQLLFDAHAREVERDAGLTMIRSAFDPNVMVAEYDRLFRRLIVDHPPIG